MVKTERAIYIQGEFMKKTYNDLIFAFFQINSKCDGEGVRYCDTKINNVPIVTAICDTLRMKDKTVRRKIEKLIDGGFVIKEEDRYLIPKILKGFQYIDLYTLEYLVNTVNLNVIKVYAYLLNKVKNVDEHYIFSKKELIQNCLGVKSITHDRDYVIIEDILNCLQANDLLVLTETKKVFNFGEAKTFYYQIENLFLSNKYIDKKRQKALKSLERKQKMIQSRKLKKFEPKNLLG